MKNDFTECFAGHERSLRSLRATETEDSIKYCCNITTGAPFYTFRNHNRQALAYDAPPEAEFGPSCGWWYSNCVMGMPSLLRKVFLVDLLQGLKVTFRYQDPKEIYTEQYPLERPQVAERYRGAPRLNVNPDTDETMCIACDLCALACPEHLIVVSSERNEKTRRKELTNFTYDLSRCMFCGLCEDACPTDALELTQDFELASYTRQGWIWDRETLEKGPEPTQYQR